MPPGELGNLRRASPVTSNRNATAPALQLVHSEQPNLAFCRDSFLGMITISIPPGPTSRIYSTTPTAITMDQIEYSDWMWFEDDNDHALRDEYFESYQENLAPYQAQL
jgi:hypothetical protein